MMDGLPDNWEKWPLADVGEWLGGGTPSSSNAQYWNGDIPWVSPKDMKVAVIKSTQDKITKAAIDNSAAKLVPAHAVLFVTRSGILARSFPVATTLNPVTVNQDLKAIVPNPAIDYEYLAWTLRFFERNVLTSCSKHGTTVHGIEVPSLKSLKVKTKIRAILPIARESPRTPQVGHSKTRAGAFGGTRGDEVKSCNGPGKRKQGEYIRTYQQKAFSSAKTNTCWNDYFGRDRWTWVLQWCNG
jgi:hypothetical protein